MIDIFNNFYKGKKVLVTGHTGFKGSWLSIWLHELGAEVVGVGLEPYSEKDNFVLSGIGKKIKADIRADIRDGEKMKEIFKQYQPEIVFHLAAQPLVRLSYEIPVETYQTNVMGTINIMEAIRATDSVKVGVMITTDKCYDNKEQMRGYKEDDPFGGYDPYSSSKGACEIAIQSWRRSFFNPEDYGKKHHVSLASPRCRLWASLLARFSVHDRTSRTSPSFLISATSPCFMPSARICPLTFSVSDFGLAPMMYWQPSLVSSSMLALLSRPASATTMGLPKPKREASFLISGIMVCPSEMLPS